MQNLDVANGSVRRAERHNIVLTHHKSCVGIFFLWQLTLITVEADGVSIPFLLIVFLLLCVRNRKKKTFSTRHISSVTAAGILPFSFLFIWKYL